MIVRLRCRKVSVFGSGVVVTTVICFKRGEGSAEIRSTGSKSIRAGAAVCGSTVVRRSVVWAGLGAEVCQNPARRGRRIAKRPDDGYFLANTPATKSQFTTANQASRYFARRFLYLR